MIAATMHPQAAAAVRAARCWHTWGAHAARRYAVARGVPMDLLVLARVLEAARRAGL